MKTYFTWDSTVKLFKIVTTKGGTLRYPGVYSKANPLNKEFMNSDYCTLISGKEESVSKVSPSLEKETENESNSTYTEDKNGSNLEIKNVNPVATKIEEVELKPKTNDSSFEPGTESIKINFTEIQPLIDLDGIGKGTAKKIMSLREMSPFISYEDLNTRVPLVFGRNWTDFNIDFE